MTQTTEGAEARAAYLGQVGSLSEACDALGEVCGSTLATIIELRQMLGQLSFQTNLLAEHLIEGGHLDAASYFGALSRNLSDLIDEVDGMRSAMGVAA